MEFRFELDMRGATILFMLYAAHLGKQDGVVD
jgi:hypothetical protein